MADASPGIRVLEFTESVLTADSVARLERALREARDTIPTVLDCSALREVSPAGLSALLELGRSVEGIQELALASLDRTITLMAVQAGLAERFAIYASSAAFVRDQERARESERCEP